jgi:hypothetical protein
VTSQPRPAGCEYCYYHISACSFLFAALKPAMVHYDPGNEKHLAAFFLSGAVWIFLGFIAGGRVTSQPGLTGCAPSLVVFVLV